MKYGNYTSVIFNHCHMTNITESPYIWSLLFSTYPNACQTLYAADVVVCKTASNPMYYFTNMHAKLAQTISRPIQLMCDYLK